MNILNGEFKSINEMRDNLVNHTSKSQNTKKPFGNLYTGKSFRDILISESSREESGELKFSKHASQRLVSRNIQLSKEQIARLSEGADRARKKGIRESLIMVDELAFIVNVKNNLVVTAVGESDDKIFTNIDGAVVG